MENTSLNKYPSSEDGDEVPVARVKKYIPILSLLGGRIPGFVKLVLSLCLMYIALFIDIAPCTGQGCAYWVYHGPCSGAPGCSSLHYSCTSGDSSCSNCNPNDYMWFCFNNGCSAPGATCACAGPVHSLAISGSVVCPNPGNGSWCLGGAHFDVSATDSDGSHAVSILGSINGSSFGCGPTNGGASCSQTLGDGSNLPITYYASCPSGSTGTTNTSWSQDSVPPLVSFTLTGGITGANGWYTNGPVSLDCSVTDSLSGPGVVTYAAQTANGDGTHTLSCTGSDVAGNTSTASTGVRIDGTPPDIIGYLDGGTVGANGWYTAGPVSLVCNALDATSGVNAAGVVYGVQTATNEGDTNVGCSATDYAGNSGSASTNVRIDSLPPVASFIFTGISGLGGWFTSDVSVGVNASDTTSGVASIEISIDGSVGTLASGDGIHPVSAIITDNAGNTTTINGTIYIDTSAPSTGFLTGSGWVRGAVSIAGTASDGTSGTNQTYISVDGGTTWIPVGTGGNWSYIWDTSGFSDGSHIIQAYTIDTAGNPGPVASLTLFVDNTSPNVGLNPSIVLLGSSTTIISTDVGSGVYSARLTISGNGITPRIIDIPAPSGNDVIQWDGLDGNGNTAPIGIYTITVEVWDAVGNYAFSTGSWTRPYPWVEPSSTPWPTRTPSRSPTPTGTFTNTNSKKAATATRNDTAGISSSSTKTLTPTTGSANPHGSATTMTNTATPIGGFTPTSGTASDLLPYLAMLGAGLVTTVTGKAIQSKQKGNASPIPSDVSLINELTVYENQVVMEPKVIETKVPHMVEEQRNIIEKIQSKDNVTINKLPPNAKKWEINKTPVLENGIRWITRTVTEKVQRGWDDVRETVMVPVVKRVPVIKIDPGFLPKSLIYGGRTLSIIAVIGMLGSCGNLWSILGINTPTTTPTFTMISTRTKTRTATKTSTITPTKTKTPTRTSIPTPTKTWTSSPTIPPATNISPAGKSFIIKWEIVMTKLYNDPFDCTIGIGHWLHKGVCDGKHPEEIPYLNGITVEEAYDLFYNEDLPVAVSSVRRLVTAPLNQCQFDALVDLEFNTGGLIVFPGLNELNKVNRDINLIVEAIINFRNYTSNLADRRRAEAKVFSQCIY